MQIEPTGSTVSRISLIVVKASNFLPSSDGLPSAQSTTAPIASDSMLTRFDQLCESLGDTLREVVIALFPWQPEYFEALQADPVKTMRGLRDQMPSMARRQCLTFCMSRTRRGLMEDGEYDTMRKAVFDRESQCWTNIALDN